MRYSNVDYNVLYVDPSRSANGNGSTPATAMNALPASASSIPERTCYLVRRTDESKALTLPTGSSSVTCLMILGMPLPADPMWELVPEAAKTAWGSDSAAYANVFTFRSSQPEAGTDPSPDSCGSSSEAFSHCHRPSR